MKKVRLILFIGLLIFISDILQSYAEQKVLLNPNRGTILPPVIDKNTTLSIENNPYYIKSDFTVKKNVVLTILPGVEIDIEKNYSIYVYGSIKSLGDKQNHIIFKDFYRNKVWQGINFVDNNKESVFEFTDFFNGIIYSRNSKIRFLNSSFNNSNIELKTPFIYLISSSVSIDSCYMASNNTGDGIVIQGGNNISVRNSRFSGTGDAIEYSNVNYGIIKNNIVENSIDDCIDINGSKNLEITGNILSNAFDKGISIGNSLNSLSTGINLLKNIIISCKYAIAIKGNSYAKIYNNTFYNNETCIYCYQKSEGSGGGNVEVKNTIFSHCSTNYDVDKYSTISVDYSLCDTDSLKGKNNLFSNPMFLDQEHSIFYLRANSPCIDAGDPNTQNDPDGTRVDIGALPYNQKIDNIGINEINYHSSADYDSGDWIEIYNKNDERIDLSNWKLIFSDNSSFNFPVNTFIEKDSFLVIIRNENKFSLIYPDVKNKIGSFVYDLSGIGSFIKLNDAYGRLIDTVYFSSKSPWSQKPDGGGSSLELVATDKDNNKAENWKTSINHGTPGKTNSIITNYIDDSFGRNNLIDSLIVFPNPTQDILRIKFLNSISRKIEFKIYDMQGNERKIKNTSKSNFNKNFYITITLDNLQSGIYLLLMNIDSETFTKKFCINK